MTATTQAGAFSPAQVDWSAINWTRVNQNVRRLQVRIVKATQARRWSGWNMSCAQERKRTGALKISLSLMRKKDRTVDAGGSLQPLHQMLLRADFA